MDELELLCNVLVEVLRASVQLRRVSIHNPLQFQSKMHRNKATDFETMLKLTNRLAPRSKAMTAALTQDCAEMSPFPS